jgi:hypothetical protein
LSHLHVVYLFQNIDHNHCIFQTQPRLDLLLSHDDIANQLQDLAILDTEIRPGLRTDREDRRVDGVVPERYVRMKGIDLIWEDESERIFLSVHLIPAKREKCLIPVDAYWPRAKSLEGLRNDRYRRHAYLQSLKILRPTDRAF